MPADELPTISVVVPTFMRLGMLPQVLQPLLDDMVTPEVIVVVDGGNDGSYEYLEERALREPRLRPFLIANAGQAGAQQYGAERASGEVILFLDDDVIPEPGLVGGHARRHQEAADLVVLGYMPVVLAAAAGQPEWIGRRYAERYESKTRSWEREPERILATLWGGNVSVRACHVRDIPLLNRHSAIGYHVDLEFGIRAWEAGLRGVFDRGLISHHHYARTVSQFLRDRAVSAADRKILHQLHPDVLGELTGDYFSRDASMGARLILQIVRGRSRWPEHLLACAVHAMGRMHMFRSQELAADLIDRMMGQRITCAPDNLADEAAVRRWAD